LVRPARLALAIPPEPDKMAQFSQRSQVFEHCPHTELARLARRLSCVSGPHPVCHWLLFRSAAAAGVWHPVVLAARGRCQPDRHRVHGLDSTGLWLQVAVVTAGRSTAPATALPLAGAASQLDDALPDTDCR